MSENLLNLVNTIRDRKNKDKDKSYTSSLLSSGLSKCIDKMEEEFSELKEALNDKSNVVHEAADTIYHILVTLEVADIKFEDVLKELESRKKQSGINEKKEHGHFQIFFCMEFLFLKFLQKYYFCRSPLSIILFFNT